jgi:hypothetical protein
VAAAARNAHHDAGVLGGTAWYTLASPPCFRKILSEVW